VLKAGDHERGPRRRCELSGARHRDTRTRGRRSEGSRADSGPLDGCPGRHPGRGTQIGAGHRPHEPRRDHVTTIAPPAVQPRWRRSTVAPGRFMVAGMAVAPCHGAIYAGRAKPRRGRRGWTDSQRAGGRRPPQSGEGARLLIPTAAGTRLSRRMSRGISRALPLCHGATAPPRTRAVRRSRGQFARCCLMILPVKMLRSQRAILALPRTRECAVSSNAIAGDPMATDATAERSTLEGQTVDRDAVVRV
jgi:hypothetical protein